MAHPNLAPRCAPEEHCITCGDEAVAMRIVELDATSELAVGEDAEGARSTVEIAFVQGTSVGDTLLVHAGVALAKLPDGAEHGT